ncbi:MurR/RpiR family transcriptional regulator [Spiroplasma endosymbiont of Stenodema calcarata]|uniref:MurR/RpiR family transcriptional regulator n=1 Tax=Spiroplasma endosymbiont of Stenodema calcarata TaxID=3139328 RepID=UPI003CCA8E02
MIPIIIIDLYYLTSLEKYIVSEINKRPKYFLSNSITIISQNFGIATSTISRLAKKIGFKNFKELKIFIGEKIKQIKTSFDFQYNDKLSNIIQNIKNINLYSIFDTINNLDLLEINDIINCIFISKRIFVFGVGSSIMICSELSNSLIKLGFNSYTSQDFYEQLLFLNTFKNNNMIILFSKAGYTREINELVKLSKKNNIKTILITNEHQSNNFINPDYKILYYSYYHEKITS